MAIEKRLELVKRNLPRIIRRAVLSIVLTWLVLLILSALQGFCDGSPRPVSVFG